MGEGKKQKPSGVRKRPSEPIYPADVLSDMQLMMCDLATFGAWWKCLLYMLRDDTDRIECDFKSLSRLWGCTLDEARRYVAELFERNVCQVTVCNDQVSLISRRRNRMLKDRKSTANRVRKHREKKRNTEETDAVTLRNMTPSSSSSFSPSLSGTKVPSSPQPPSEESGLPLADEVYKKHPPLKVLHYCPMLRGIQLEQYLKCKQKRHRCMDFLAAAKAAVDRAELDMDIRKPALFLDACWGYYEDKHRETLNRKEKLLEERESEYNDLVAFLRENADQPEMIERAKNDLAERWGKSFVDKAVEEAHESI